MIKFVGTAQADFKESLLFFFQTKRDTNFFKAVKSENGFEFGDDFRYIIVKDQQGRDEKSFDWKSLRASKQADKFFITYKSNKNGNNLYSAESGNLIHWEKIGKLDITETGTVIPDYKNKNRKVMYYGEKEIKIAYSSNLLNWKTEGKVVLSPRGEEKEIEVGNAYIIPDGILLTYYSKRKSNGASQVDVGAVIFEKNKPEEVIWRSEKPIWEVSDELENESLDPLGSVILGDQLVLYFVVGENNVFAVSCEVPNKSSGLAGKSFTALFNKSDKNPIIAPRPDKPWESRATFNSAAVYEDGKVHFVYRALGDTDLSVLGYATSTDGINIDERSDEPIYIPREAFETPGQKVFATFADHFASGGGYGGIEDPRITKIDNRFFMTYVAFDGANPPRVALTSIDSEDFVNKRFDRWDKPKLISAPGMVNKNAVIFPEKIKGKYVVFHRIFPNILADYVDDLKFDKYLEGQYFIAPRKKYWDSKKIGAGAPPIKTNDGWLFIYQSVGHQEPHKYKIGAMLLDHNNPTKVLYRTNSPIVEPVESYENEGFKSGVVYPCGAVTMNNKLHVYYGGADTVTCAASADLDNFLWEMKKNREPKLTKVSSSLFN